MFTCAHAAAAVAASAALLTAAALTPIPLAALPMLVAICSGFPLVAAWDLSIAIAVLSAGRSARQEPGHDSPRLHKRALSELRERLDQLPETEHPLGF
jgi:hypothetical protein